MTPAPRPRRRRLRLGIGLGALLLLWVAVPLITLPQAQASILRALQASLGRTVRADAVHLQLLPLPGVELDGVRLSDDPAFGPENMVVADDAVATISLSSLWRGRLVFSRVHLDQASINLVRNAAGRWNVAALLDRVAHPPGHPPPGRGGRPAAAAQRFPYVDWSNARINFKLGQTKTRFYLNQVEGSLAREASDWRLQASFQPQRTDLNLSNTGEVTLDGRWQTPGAGGFRQAPFDLAVRLQDSYLAGSSALLVGHDAGVHGIVSARLQVQGNGEGFRIQGTVRAQALRRWDLLPPPATINASVAGTYIPSQDRFQLEGLGDPGFAHVRLQGEVSNLFTQPSADLQLRLQQVAAADLLPVAMALKARLPASLRAAGEANGGAHLQWQAGSLRGQGRVEISHLRLSDAQGQLTWPAAALVWNGQQLQLLPSPAQVERLGAAATPVRLGASADRRGFQFELASNACTPAAAATLARLLGMASPWPPRLAGTARLQVRLAAPWAEFRHVGWSGSVWLARARFAPEGAPALPLQQVAVSLAGGKPWRAAFRLDLAPGGAEPVAGSLQWTPGAEAPVSFALRARRVESGAVWTLLRPPPRDLMQRVLGAAAGGDWLARLQAQGSVAVADLDWHGIHTALAMQLQSAGGQWAAPRLRLGLAQGRFEGHGGLRGGDYDIAGAVPAGRALRLAQLLQPTPYRGWLSGRLSGSLRLERPVAGTSLRQLDASGVFLLRGGALATGAGPARFERFAGRYRLQGGAATLSQLVWIADGVRWTGSGTARFGAAGQVQYALELQAGGRRRRLAGPPAAAPGRRP
ncbi:MAG TPA: AsmA family protein [Terriglobales bacterium]|nr:AsmA family protein [Terriglobales bacterium]